MIYDYNKKRTFVIEAPYTIDSSKGKGAKVMYEARLKEAMDGCVEHIKKTPASFWGMEWHDEWKTVGQNQVPPGLRLIFNK